jgi:hypothetical protein
VPCQRRRCEPRRRWEWWGGWALVFFLLLLLLFFLLLLLLFLCLLLLFLCLLLHLPRLLFDCRLRRAVRASGSYAPAEHRTFLPAVP